MEEENKKERKGMKRSHNDAVRELVAFVRKRDKRLAAHQSIEAKKRLQREEEEKQRCQSLANSKQKPLRWGKSPCAGAHALLQHGFCSGLP